MSSPATVDDPEVYSQAVAAFREFFISGATNSIATTAIHETFRSLHAKMERGEEAIYRHLLDLDELKKHNGMLARGLMNNPLLFLRAATEALEQGLVETIHDRELLQVKKHIGIHGSFGAHFVSPRQLKSKLLGKLVCLEGIVTRISIVRPKLVKAVQYCPKTDKFKEREFVDVTDLDPIPTSMVLAREDQDGNVLEMEFGLSEYRNHQRATIQEMPERAPSGQLPRSVEVVLENDLVDRCKPGDRVQIAGIYRALGGVLSAGRAGALSGNFRSMLVSNYIQLVGRDVDGVVTFTPQDLKNIKEVGAKSNVFDHLSASLAPSIFGHLYIKKAILLLLLGGVEKNLPNGAHLRGDINMLMVGDPSTAKSQLLRFVLGIAPLAISTTGRGSTGVGLTAAVTSDPDTGDRKLEAGAMVLADRGVVLIDEFDKMSDADRVAIHEVMEQQTVTIAKAGVHASLNARCSVVAAANPIYGMYDRNLTTQRNVNLPDSLLSRFDLLFIVLDSTTPQTDRAISDHVLRMHRYQRPGFENKPYVDSQQGNGEDRRDDEMDENGMGDDSTSPMFQKFNPLLHGGFAEAAGNTTAAIEGIFSVKFLRKYIHYAKTKVPELTAEACNIIGQEYVELRQEQATKTIPITPRCLETLIRLSSAHAKARLSTKVEEKDCIVAKEILRFALFNEAAGEQTKSKSRKKGDVDEDEEEDVKASGEKKKRGGAAAAAKSKSKRVRVEDDNDDESSEESTSSEEEDDDDDDVAAHPTKKKRTTTTTEQDENVSTQQLLSDLAGDKSHSVDQKPAIVVATWSFADRAQFFKLALGQLFKKSEMDDILVDEALTWINDSLRQSQLDGENEGWEPYEKSEAAQIFELLEDENVVMYREGVIFKV